MLDADAAYFAFACFGLFIAYGAGQSSGSKGVKRRIRKALDQHEVDVEHGYNEGYSGLGLGRIIRDIIS
jgi:hypothetical protein